MALEMYPMLSHHFRKQNALLLLFVRATWFRSVSVAVGHHYNFLETPNMVTQAEALPNWCARCYSQRRRDKITRTRHLRPDPQ
jgi:hypothetical protein